MDQLLAGQQIDTARINADRGVRQGEATQNFTQYQLPQLVSGIAANGQYGSSARQKDEAHAYTGYLQNSYDIQSASQRQLDDLTRQRMFASLGLVI